MFTFNYRIIFFYSRSAVLRGRVVTETGRGLVGVRVTHSDLHTEGYTMTQEDGWFDFMVNGGGAITLKFGKSPFPAQVRTLFAPWNEVRFFALELQNGVIPEIKLDRLSSNYYNSKLLYFRLL